MESREVGLRSDLQMIKDVDCGGYREGEFEIRRSGMGPGVTSVTILRR